MSQSTNLSGLKPILRNLRLSELHTLVEWAREEGWNPGPNDADIFWNTDPDGFVGFFIDDQMIGGGAIISYEGKFGFMGLFILRPEYRGLGLGRDLWYLRRNRLIERLQKGATIGMDGVVAMQNFYAEGGFSLAYRENRYERRGAAYAISDSVSAIKEEEIPDVIAYDKIRFGFERSKFLIPWLENAEERKFRYSDQGIFKGYAVVRKAHVGYKIGPLYAENTDVAEALYKACLNSVIDEVVSIDVPIINQEAMAMIKSYEANYIFECGRMYFGNQPSFDVSKVYGVSSFELG